MPSIKDIKTRIGTVKNTQQTTRAMKMVSAAKLRRAQEAIQNQRPYARAMDDLIRKVSGLDGVDSHPLVASREGGALEVEGQLSSAPKKTVLLLVTSDRGLCGGFNSNIIKAAQQWLAADAKRRDQVELCFVGKRGNDFFKSRKFPLGQYFVELGGKVTFAKARTLSEALIARYLRGDVAEVKVIYNEFKNAALQQVRVETFLPLMPQAAAVGATGTFVGTQALVKPDAAAVFEKLISKNFAIQCFRILLESQAGEHGARMSAMENATKNAGEMIQRLTLQYNKQRQAGITKELLEIIAGSESQKG
jgi:F-type H+-transporting ATPase subunit gamma